MTAVKTQRLRLSKSQYAILGRTPVDERNALITKWTDELNGIVREVEPKKVTKKAKAPKE